ncbi:MAG: HPr kinase/phosphatase C-terminal domain-containing protein [Hyphomicrobiaceae bacterium]|nr:HPr kinase/phosphatase C-terminal domain-containing protein [Hyphomicrobiaceae bacterium]
MTTTDAPGGPVRETIHATTIAIGSRAILLRGPSGAGKSDLALRCLALPAGRFNADPVELIADDYTVVSAVDGVLWASAPPALGGKLEVRGLGIVDLPAITAAAVALVCDLVPPHDVVRMPEDGLTVTLCNVAIPSIRLHAFEASAPLKLFIALSCQGNDT